MKKLLVCLSIFLSTNVYAKITAYFSHNPIKQGDSVELILSSEKPFQGVANIEVVQKDFLVGGQQQRQSSQWINGKGSTQYQLSYTLFPNRAGDLTVRGLKVGNESIPDITLKVTADAKYEQQGALSLTVYCPKEAVYPAQRLICSVFLDDSMGLIDGEILAPQTVGGVWQQISPLVPVDFNASKGLRSQSMVAFTPTQSGKIKVPPFVLDGQIHLETRQPARSTSIFDLMTFGIRSSATRPVSAQSKPFTLVVKEKPSDYKGWWLPSSEVTLSESYDLPSTIHVGDPISRTLTLKAADVSANDLPIPEASVSGSGFKVYTNPAQREDLGNGSELQVALTFVPTQAGALTLPSIKVPWFDVTNEKIREAVVPAKTIFVESDPSAAATTPSVNPPVKQVEPRQQTQLQHVDVAQVGPFPWLFVIAVGVGAFAIGLSVAWLLLRRKHSHESERKKKKPLPDLYPF